MGRKKKFIDKTQASTFHVVHRSQQDKAKEGEVDVSEFVLIPSGRPPRDDRGRGRKNGDGKTVAGAGAIFGARRDHINALGFPNDGYDYEQHLKSIGGGTFVSKNGKVKNFVSAITRSGGPALTIPEEALPSEEMLDRQLEAVTISEKVMDVDMRKALAGELDGVEEGCSLVDEDNLLDDDFVMQAAGADDDEGGFDFDAHVARLMEASARETGLRERTAEDDLETKGLSRLRRDGGGSSDDPGSGPDAESDDSGEFDEAMLEGLDINEGQGDRKRAGVLGEGVDGREALDSQFEATLVAYDSDEWGELEEDDERVKGHWDPAHHEFANRCLDDFLESKEDANWIDGVERLPQERRAVVVENIENGGAGGNPIGTRAAGEGQGTGGSPGGVGGAAGGMSASGPRLGKLRGLGCEGVDNDERDEGKEDEEEEEEDLFDDIGRHNEYLRERQVEQWDCETIISTYSNLDNHPSVIGTGRKVKPRRPRGPVAVANAIGGSGMDEVVKKVVLSEKTGMPLGVLPEKATNDEGMISLTAGKNFGEKRDAEETAEEKRLRKAKIKQEKRDKRAHKKGVKMAFAAEANVIKHALANPEAPQNRSVFNYS